MKNMNIYDLVRKILGGIQPVAETHCDDEKYENLKATIELVELLIGDIGEVAKEKDRQEFSVSRAGKRANEFLITLFDSIKEFERPTTGGDS